MRIKLVWVENIYDECDYHHIIRNDMSPWQEVTKEEYDLLCRELRSDKELNNSSISLSPQIIVDATSNIPKYIEDVKMYVAEREAKRLEAKKAAEKKRKEKELKKLAKTREAEIELAKNLAQKHGIKL